MFRAVALVPSPPLLVPELTGRGSGADSLIRESGLLRDAALAVAAELGSVADRWIAVGSAEKTTRISSRASGSFAGFGVDVPVRLSPAASERDEALPLAALIAGWLRGEVAPRAVVDVVLVGANASLLQCRDLGASLRSEMDAEPSNWGLLVVGDGATTLTAKAPGSFDQRAVSVQKRIDDALAFADVEALASLDRDVCAELGVRGWAAWQALAGLVGDDRISAKTLYRGAPFGVGYFVGSWEPQP
ncbi:class III extradiol dioxygenase subunit B-like domain-containing protein [Rhodococcus sp. G-MC3]|uniref:class III extradiol dioxygenase subunit B-like domain-containing protein n=1 Tax=Rhodococcus sp. G-MC3 TaxID=3046209 RepID=UPI0024BA2293|nr:class III extradiol dioxygenase subunit B-like domain-containing protein [Rhodococcus sp. G-MC3]MDJ0391777.1 class III extradiol dioxygenase subunit B-like domain-containing protein [Rhodococcus sp. G-MC3]